MDSNIIIGTYREPLRPRFHYSPRENWINDPCGLFFYKGQYHLFCQYNPTDKVWGNMHWNHAVSTDLLHWQERPIAIESEPEGLGFIFTGSTVVDWHNTSGLGADGGEHPPIVSIYTQSSRLDHQVQSLAVSTDGGERWRVHEGNPVLANPGEPDFRDPKVLRDERRDEWIMVLAVGQKISFYRSDNLLQWQHAFDFGDGCGCHDGVWECPDLFPLTEPESGAEKWVLLVSVNPGGPNGGSATQYFIGEFDGASFVPDDAQGHWLDYGPDLYAATSWSDVPEEDGRRLLIGWMSNWDYANAVPTAPWRGTLTLPRELRLVQTRSGLRVAAPPAAEVDALRDERLAHLSDIAIAEHTELCSLDADALLCEIRMVVETDDAPPAPWHLQLAGDDGEAISLEFDPTEQRLNLDRSRAAHGMANRAHFPGLLSAPLPVPPTPSDSPHRNRLELCLLIDRASVEIFTGQGLSLLTSIYFTRSPLTRLSIEPTHDARPVVLKELDVTSLKGIW